jgi:hypothetical protein
MILVVNTNLLIEMKIDTITNLTKGAIQTHQYTLKGLRALLRKIKTKCKEVSNLIIEITKML